MPAAKDLLGHEVAVIYEWLARVSATREQQRKLFDYLLTNHPTDSLSWFNLAKTAWALAYPIQPYNVGYNPKLHTIQVNAFPDQYRALDKVLGTILKHVTRTPTYSSSPTTASSPSARGSPTTRIRTTPVLPHYRETRLRGW